MNYYDEQSTGCSQPRQLVVDDSPMKIVALSAFSFDSHHGLVSNLESQLVDQESRRLVLKLLDKLMVTDYGHFRGIVVTTSVDPIAHFRELFNEERVSIYTDDAPEVSLSRAAQLLSSFGRETGVPFNDLVRELRRRANAYYEMLWTNCTRKEKLVLIQFAQEGFVTAQSWDVVASLVVKGLLAGGLFFLLTQDFSVQSLLPIVSGTGMFGAPLFRTLIARLSGKALDATA
jgi:hypothetical protein